jgi:hypothetical protein
MSDSKNASRLAWLVATLGNHRERMADLLRKLATHGTRESMTTSLFRKFLTMLDQIAEAKTEETRILGRIENIEKIHHSRRKNNQLRRAKLIPLEIANAPEKDPECARPGTGLLGLLAFWYLFMCRGMNEKKQSLTID